MASQSRKHRGYETQRIVSRFWQKCFPYVTDTGAGRNGKDLLNTGKVAVEIKARTGFSPLEWVRQATASAAPDELPCVVIRPNGTGETTVHEWPVIVRHQDFLDLLRKAGYADPITVTR